MLKRGFDIFFSIIALILLSPICLLLAVCIVLGSRGGVFYTQERVGRDGRNFRLIKFRTMIIGASLQGVLTIGENDQRITRFGRFLRSYKIDEIPQIINIIKGEMSFVGPRPEVRKYVTLYSKEQLKVLAVRPGLTDYASLEFFNENTLLGSSANPEETYINKIMPAKLALNLKYINDQSLKRYFFIIFKTLLRVIKRT
ncbi:MAG: sugar transferase [Bacteroidales bacterium]|nr:sugar transferase [Bacteroidales bacterium]